MTRYSVNDLPARLRDRVVIDGDTGCWIVQNSRPRSDTPSEYRGISYGGQLWQTHVLAYTLLIGPVPVGLMIDHVWDRGCRSKACCYPGHLEAVTDAENSRRRVAARWNRLPATGNWGKGCGYELGQPDVSSRPRGGSATERSYLDNAHDA